VQSMHKAVQGAPGPLLTAQQVHRMLGIDRSTVYRMAEDGRLPGLKIGRQWRFRPEQIQRLLVGVSVTDAVHEAPLTRSAVAAASVIEVAADLLGVMMVVADMHGVALTQVANPCEWFNSRSQDLDFAAACAAEWRLLADELDLEPRFCTGRMGFDCARAYIRSGNSLVGMVLAGGVAPPGSDRTDLYRLQDDQRRRVLGALPQVAAVLSRAIQDCAPRPSREAPAKTRRAQ